MTILGMLARVLLIAIATGMAYVKRYKFDNECNLLKER